MISVFVLFKVIFSFNFSKYSRNSLNIAVFHIEIVLIYFHCFVFFIIQYANTTRILQLHFLKRN